MHVERIVVANHQFPHQFIPLTTVEQIEKLSNNFSTQALFQGVDRPFKLFFQLIESGIIFKNNPGPHVEGCGNPQAGLGLHRLMKGFWHHDPTDMEALPFGD